MKMTTKTKILIGILVVGVVLIGGLWILNNQPSESGSSEQVYKKGEPIKFQINDKVKICTGQVPFSIVNAEGKSVKLLRTCHGIVGYPLKDPYCENGKIVWKRAETASCISPAGWWAGCTDTILCKEERIDETFVWDQKEYIVITEECEGKTIQREEKRQVSPGKYQILVNGKIIKEFVLQFEKPSEIKKICMPNKCCILICENDAEVWYECKEFGKVCKPPLPECPGTTTWYILGKRVNREEYLQKIKEKNEECGNCLKKVWVPCR